MKEQNMPKVTLKTVAEHVGTSIGTVDRALSNRPGISPATKEKVLAAAKELGYKPNKFASALGRKRLIRLGVVFPTEQPEFYNLIERGVDDAAKELRDYGIQIDKIRYRIQHPRLSEEMLASIDTELYDGLAVNATGSGSARQIDRLVAKGLPVVTFNTDTIGCERLFYLGSNSLQSGRMGAELLARLLGGRGGVTVLGNFAQATPFSERFGGFCEVIHSEYPGITIFPCAECYSEPHLAAKSLFTLLSENEDVRGVFCTGYSSTMGAIEALKEMGRRDIVLVGYDTGGQMLDALEEGWCDALLFQNPSRQGYEAVHLLAKHICEGWTPREKLLHIETQIVLKHNAESYRSGILWSIPD